ncbi:MAG: hypothetical protein HOL08_02615 [Opitutae bacterium]|nr:hypothetical protein [Opitutae bacterium]
MEALKCSISRRQSTTDPPNYFRYPAKLVAEFSGMHQASTRCKGQLAAARCIEMKIR